MSTTAYSDAPFIRKTHHIRVFSHSIIYFFFRRSVFHFRCQSR